MSAMKVDFCGIEFKNPIITASGTFGYGMEFSKFYDVSVLGGISVKGITMEPREGNPAPRIAETPSGMLNCVGLQNPGIDKFIADELPRLKKFDTVILANVAGKTEEDYIAICERISGTDIKIIELNISCPNVKAGGIGFGVEPKSVEKITSAVRKHCSKKLVVKLTPNVANIADNARAAECGGADGVSLINTLTGMSIDIKKRKPLLSNIHGGLSGPCVKPVALKMVYDVFNAVKIPIIGMGGITTYTDAVEFLLAGARLVQVGTANLTNPMAAKVIVEQLTAYCERENIADVTELIGACHL